MSRTGSASKNFTTFEKPSNALTYAFIQKSSFHHYIIYVKNLTIKLNYFAKNSNEFCRLRSQKTQNLQYDKIYGVINFTSEVSPQKDENSIKLL